jgi:hypothetical protein
MAIAKKQLLYAKQEQCFLCGQSDTTMSNGVFCKANAKKLEVASVNGQSLVVQRQSF